MIQFPLQANEALNAVGETASKAITLVNNPTILLIGIILIVITIAIIFFLKKIIINSILGFITWFIVTQFFHISLPLIPSLVISIIFGMAGIGAMLLLKFFGLLAWLQGNFMLKEFNCDLHFHSYYSGGTSKDMLLPIIAEQARLKGLDFISTSDCLNKEWLSHLEKNLSKENKCLTFKQFDVKFVLGTEVHDKNNIHTIIFLPDFDAVYALKEKLSKHGKLDGFGNGRPYINLSTEKITEIVTEVNGLIGPAHAFTPYFSVFAHFNSLKDAFKSQLENIKFIELGLSADTYYADLIEELHKVEFLSNSDCHSPWPHRLGREFNRIILEKPNFDELKKAFERKNERKLTLNVKVDPREGKYHCTACSQCFQKYSVTQAIQLKWKCIKCSAPIKKGVRDRILELASFREEIHPEYRAKCIHIIPLAEIIKIALEVQNINSKKVQSIWREFIDAFKTEINVLIDTPIEKLFEVNEVTAKKIEAFRKGYVLYNAGGGGNYGIPIICDSKEDFELKKEALKNELDCNTILKAQKTLKDF